MDLSSGTVTIRTAVEGSAARMGHRLVIRVDDWSATVTMTRKKPAAVSFRAALGSLRVESGSGGVTPLSPVDRQVILRNAAKTLESKRYPEVTFQSNALSVSDGTVEVAGDLTIHGVTRSLEAVLEIAAGRATASIPVRQSDFGVKPYSLMLGQLRVGDEVIVDLDIEVPG